MTGADERLYQFSELRLAERMTFFEQIRVGMATEEFNDVPEFFIGGLIPYREDFLEMFVRRPDLMATKIDALVKAMSACHALQVDPVEFTATSEGKVITYFIHFLQSHDLVFMAG